MKTKYPSPVIAEYFIQKDKNMRSDIMKVLKLVYISHGFNLAIFNTPLIKEKVQAWQYGPVIPELYFRLKTNDLDTISVFYDDVQRLERDEDTKKLLDAVYTKYGKYDGIQLSNLTHQKKTPWDITVNKYESEITEDLIKEHYKTLLSIDE
jgi:uncharacterized phage-associated protein